ncbi:MAG TPA: hypothetical protein VH008_13630 [Pseudonocardia sp.]|nr:hypothetical protein [Pseudonocardia sp.]
MTRTAGSATLVRWPGSSERPVGPAGPELVVRGGAHSVGGGARQGQRPNYRPGPTRVASAARSVRPSRVQAR